MTEKANVALPARVEKVIKSPDPREPDKAQINIEDGADPLYKEIRIENSLTDNKGNKVKLKEGEKVKVTVELPLSEAMPKDKDDPGR